MDSRQDSRIRQNSQNDQHAGDDQHRDTAEQRAGGHPSPEPSPTSTLLDAETIERVKQANPLLAVLARYGITVQGTGVHRMAQCPFHDDKRPSLGVFLDTNRFFCFGCGANGDVIALVQRVESVGFREAIRRLALGPASAEVTIGRPESSSPTEQPISPQVNDASAAGAQSLPLRVLQQPEQPAVFVVMGTTFRLPASHPSRHISSFTTSGRGETAAALAPLSIDLALLTAAAGIYQAVLRSSQSVRGYLRRRGIPPSVAQEAHLGYADGVALLHYLGHDDELLRSAHRIGLLDKQGRERLRNRLIVPEFRTGHCIWLHGRLVDRPPPLPAEDASFPNSEAAGDDEQQRAFPLSAPLKYLGCALPKPLFGVGLCEQDRAEAAGAGMTRRQSALLVVEGAFDALAVRALRIPVRCAALIGTHAGPTQRRELLQLADGAPIWLALDADLAGDAGADHLAAWLHTNGYPGAIPRVRPPCGAKDLAELVELVGQRGARKALVDVLPRCQQLQVSDDDVVTARRSDAEAVAQAGVAHTDEHCHEIRPMGWSAEGWSGDRDGDGGGQ